MLLCLCLCVCDPVSAACGFCVCMCVSLAGWLVAVRVFLPVYGCRLAKKPKKNVSRRSHNHFIACFFMLHLFVYLYCNGKPIRVTTSGWQRRLVALFGFRVGN